MRRGRDPRPAKGEIRPLYRHRPLAVRPADRFVDGDEPAVDQLCNKAPPRPPAAVDQQMAGQVERVFSRIVTNSSAAVGWMPTVRSKSCLVAPHCTATARP